MAREKIAKRGQEQSLVFSDFTGGLRMGVSQDEIEPNELFQADNFFFNPYAGCVAICPGMNEVFNLSVSAVGTTVASDGLICQTYYDFTRNNMFVFVKYGWVSGTTYSSTISYRIDLNSISAPPGSKFLSWSAAVASAISWPAGGTSFATSEINAAEWVYQTTNANNLEYGYTTFMVAHGGKLWIFNASACSYEESPGSPTCSLVVNKNPSSGAISTFVILPSISTSFSVDLLFIFNKGINGI